MPNPARRLAKRTLEIVPSGIETALLILFPHLQSFTHAQVKPPLRPELTDLGKTIGSNQQTKEPTEVSGTSASFLRKRDGTVVRPTDRPCATGNRPKTAEWCSGRRAAATKDDRPYVVLLLLQRGSERARNRRRNDDDEENRERNRKEKNEMSLPLCPPFCHTHSGAPHGGERQRDAHHTLKCTAILSLGQEIWKRLGGVQI